MNKKLLYAGVAIVVALGAYAFYASSDKNSQNSISQNAEEMQTAAYQENGVARVGDNYVYVNNDFGFELTFPKAWEGLNPRVVSGDAFSTQSVYMQVPAVYCNETPNPSTGVCYVSPMILTVYSKSQWDAANQGALKPAFIAENNDYVFAYATWQDGAPGLEQLDFEFPAVMSSFKFK